MAKRLIPTLNRVLVEKIVPPSKTAAGILLPEKSSQMNSGKVIAVGPGLRNREGEMIPMSVNEGGTVLLPEYGGSQVKLDDKEYHLYRDEDILGTLHDRVIFMSAGFFIYAVAQFFFSMDYVRDLIENMLMENIFFVAISVFIFLLFLFPSKLLNWSIFLVRYREH